MANARSEHPEFDVDADPEEAIEVDAAPDDEEDDEESDLEDEDDEDGTIIITDEDGNDLECLFLAIIEVDSEQYALLTPLDDEDEDDETVPLEIFLFHYKVEEDDTEIFSDISDEATFAKVRAEAEAFFDAERANGDEDVC